MVGPPTCRAVEDTVRDLWRDYFRREVGPDDDFYDLGGDSLTVADIVVAARSRGLPLRSSQALRHSTPARLAEALTIGAEGAPPVEIPALHADTTGPDEAVLPPTTGAGPALYVVHSDSHAGAERDAVAGWDNPGPVRRLPLPPAPAADPIGAVADQLARVVRADRPTGPYRVAGFGLGAVIAAEMARQLDGVELLVLVDVPGPGEPGGVRESLRRREAMLARRFALTGAETVDEIHARASAAGWYVDVAPQRLPERHVTWARLTTALGEHRPAADATPAVCVQDRVRSAALDRWAGALANLGVHWVEHGIAAPDALLRDPLAAAEIRKRLAA
ncbi:phosphopantetheine-binding protein [Dactylosporangium sp. NPDC048998]|uniref:phosphopantetheine-binding protein n=1 Tax=Dactylosporangium sp. NPDC048998 TaxID=3363976 RepID=UPI00371273BB